MTHWQAISPDALTATLVEHVAARDGLVRVALDGAPDTAPDALAEGLLDPLRERGRPAVHVRADAFWRDASLRLEYGREDVESYASWLDHDALRREVLAAAEHGHYLPSLRDPHTNRSTREAARPLAANAVVLVSGALLQGLGLPFELVVHLTMSPAALARRVPDERAWTLPAFSAYDTEVAPSDLADIVVRVDDARHPAWRVNRG